MDEFVNVPYHKKPYFLKTETQLSPSNLYRKFSATTAKGLVSFHALCALNIYLGGSKDISKLDDGEFLKNLTYQALSEENDEIFLSSDDRLEETPSIYSLVPANKIKKIESAKNIFSNIIKNIPPEDYKKFKIEYDQSNDISISEIDSDD